MQMTWSIFYNTTSFTTFIALAAAAKHFGFFLGTNLSGIINNKKDSSLTDAAGKKRRLQFKGKRRGANANSCLESHRLLLLNFFPWA